MEDGLRYGLTKPRNGTSIWRANFHEAWMGHAPPLSRCQAKFADHGGEHGALKQMVKML